MPPPRRRRRWRITRAILTALGAVALAGWLAVHLLLAWVSTHPAVLAAAVVVAGGVSYLSGRPGGVGHARTPPRAAPDDWLALSPGQFEQEVAALCRRDGCTDLRVVGGAGDLAADVLATTPDGRRILIQCKRYAPNNSVGSDHVQRVNGTYRDIHRCEQAIIVTTSYYTIDARKLARRVGIRLVDGEGLAAWARGGLPPWA